MKEEDSDMLYPKWSIANIIIVLLIISEYLKNENEKWATEDWATDDDVKKNPKFGVDTFDWISVKTLLKIMYVENIMDST